MTILCPKGPCFTNYRRPGVGGQAGVRIRTERSAPVDHHELGGSGFANRMTARADRGRGMCLRQN